MRASPKAVLVAIVVSVLAAGSTASLAQVQIQAVDSVWANEFWLGGFDDPAMISLADEAGNLYVGGEFTAYDGTAMNHVAMWDGSDWNALGSGVNGPVWTMALDAAGDLVIGGFFQTAGSVEVNAVAKWDGTAWSPLGGGLGGGTSAIAEIVLQPNGDMAVAEVLNPYDPGYRGIHYTNVRISNWNGSEWTRLGADFGLGPLEASPQLILDSDGALVTAHGQTMRSWDGSDWVRLGEFDSQQEIAIPVTGAIRIVSGELLVVGYDHSVWRWTGGTWSEFWLNTERTGFAPTKLFAGPQNSLIAIGIDYSDTDLSDGTVAEWDGSKWVVVSTFADHQALGLATFGGSIVAVGSFRGAAIGEPSYVAAWGNGRWTSVGSPAEGAGLDGTVTDIVADLKGNIYVAGDFMRAGGVEVNGIARWDGSTWSALGSGTSGAVRALALDDNGNLIAGGSYDEIGGVTANSVARWDGQQWSALGTGLAQNTTDFGSDNIWSIVADEAGSIYVGGDFVQTGDGAQAKGVARWDGSRWKQLGDGLDRAVRSLALGPDGQLVAAGFFDYDVARWTGEKWQSLGSRMNVYERITDVAISPDGTILAAGYFDQSHGVATWDGRRWVRLGDHVETVDPVSPFAGYEYPLEVSDLQDIRALEVDSAGGIIVGGRFLNAGGAVVNHLARWDGTSWAAIGSGTDATVQALIFDSNDDLYIGGSFLNAGGIPSSRIAKLHRWLPPFSGTISQASTIEELVAAKNYDPVAHGEVLRLYQAFFGRGPDIGGAKYWIGLNSDGFSIESIANFFAETDEFMNKYVGTSNELFLGAIYLNVLGRSHDKSGFDYWLKLLDNGDLARGGVVRWIAANDEFINQYPYRN